MPRWATTAMIAGVDLSTCRVLIIDGAQFMTDWKGSATIAADGTPHAQSINVGVKGNAFGVSIPYCPAASLQAIASAINTALNALPPTTVSVQLADALVSFTVNAFPDFNQGWLTHGLESEGIIANVVLRFIAASE